MTYVWMSSGYEEVLHFSTLKAALSFQEHNGGTISKQQTLW